MRTTYNTSPPLGNVAPPSRGGYCTVNHIVAISQTGTTVRFTPVFLFVNVKQQPSFREPKGSWESPLLFFNNKVGYCRSRYTPSQ